jgi:hypothetical protein
MSSLSFLVGLNYKVFDVKICTLEVYMVYYVQIFCSDYFLNI